MSGEVDFVGTFTIHHPSGDIEIQCQMMEGGDPEPENGTSRDPISGKTTTRGGLGARSDLKIGAEIDTLLWSQKSFIDESSGVYRYTAIEQMVTSRRAAEGPSVPYTGVVGKLNWGTFDINGGNNTRMLEIESGCDE